MKSLVTGALILFTVVGMRIGNAEAQQPKLYVAVGLQTGNGEVDRTINDIAKAIVENFSQTASDVAPAKVDSWDLERDWMALAKAKYTHFIVLRPPKQMDQAQSEGTQIAFDFGSLTDNGISFAGTLNLKEGVFIINSKGLILNGKKNNAVIDRESMLRVVIPMIERHFPELDGQYKWSINCISSLVGNRIQHWEESKFKMSLELYVNLHDKLRNVKPLTDFAPSTDFLPENCSSDFQGRATYDPTENADYVISTKIKPAVVDGKVNWEVQIEEEPPLRRYARKYVKFPEGSSLVFQQTLRNWGLALDRPGIPSVYKDVCTNSSIVDPQDAPRVADELTEMIRAEYFEKKGFSPDQDMGCHS